MATTKLSLGLATVFGFASLLASPSADAAKTTVHKPAVAKRAKAPKAPALPGAKATKTERRSSRVKAPTPARVAPPVLTHRTAKVESRQVTTPLSVRRSPAHAVSPKPAKKNAKQAKNTHSPQVVLQRTVRRNVTSLRRCYERALRDSTSLGGKMVFRVVVGANGTVSDVVIEQDGLGHKGFAICSQARIRSWRFAAPTKQTEVSFSAAFGR